MKDPIGVEKGSIEEAGSNVFGASFLPHFSIDFVVFACMFCVNFE